MENSDQCRLAIRKRLRVLYYEPSTGYGGSSRCLLHWLKFIDNKRFESVVVVHFNGPAIKEIKKLDAVVVVHCLYITLLKRLSLVVKGGTVISYLVFFAEFIFNILPITIFLIILAKLKKVDLIDVNSSVITGIPAILAARILRIPCSCHLHDTRVMTKKEIYFGKMVHTFFVLTKDALRVYGDLGRDRLVLLYNGIDPEDCKMSQAVKERRLEFNIPEQDFIFGVVGRITKGKGHVEFIRAAYQLVKTRKNVSFVIVGGIVVVDKDYETLLHKMVEKLDLRNRVIFTGWRDDVKEVMSIFDVLVFPTTTFPEGFGLVCVEAMSLGKPVIASFIPGPSEIVMDGYTGFLIQPGDVDALVEKMEFLLDSKNTCNEMGIAGRQRVKELFDIRLATRKLEAVYEFIMKKGELYASGS